MKILIADDDTVSRGLMEILLRKSGYDVVTAGNGAQALALLSAPGAPRLALLDWMMPELDGLEVCRRVRAREGQPYTYITLLTSKWSDDDIISGLEAGSDDYLTKPCNPKELKARLRTGQRILNLEDTLVEAREAMRFNATHDALTSLWNHGAILGLLKDELARSAREHVPVSLLLCDLDHFKQVNDVYGHLVGDEMLRQVARRLVESVGRLAEVGRYGGEEFLVVMQECGAAELRERVERLREAVVNNPFPVERGALSMSISVGAVAIGSWDNNVPIEPLLKEVDAALYLAKSTGRNRAVFADFSPQ